MKVEPALLTHPNIPKPMHGVNPRTILGDEWWDKVRHEAYAKRGHCCWACGVPARKALFHQWLEGHERYEIDYEKGRMVFVEVVALCHACHNFIHSGRCFEMLEAGKMPQSKYEEVMLHGFNVLVRAGLKPWAPTLELAVAACDRHGLKELTEFLVKHPLRDPSQGHKMRMAAWDRWRLVLDGKEYPPLHKSFEEWGKAYSGQPKEQDKDAETVLRPVKKWKV